MVKVLQVVTDNDRRGAQIFARDLGHELGRRGHDVTTVAIEAGSGNQPLEFEVLGPSRWSIPGQLRLRRYARLADVVIAHGSSTAQSCTLSLGRTRTPIVYRQISDSLQWANTRGRIFRVRAYLRQTSAVVALHRGAADVLSQHFGVPPSQITIIPNGVATDAFPLATERTDIASSVGTCRVIYLGALTEEKGVGHFVQLAKALPHVEFALYGSGPMEEMLRSGGLANLALPGTTDDPGAVLRSADVMVFPSRWGDSMPAVLIEAGLSGLPVVATDVGAARDVVEDGSTGRIVPPDDFAALVAATSELVRLLPSRRRDIGLAARERCISTFDIERVAVSWERVLESVQRSGAAIQD